MNGQGRNTGILEEPRLVVNVRGWHPPKPFLEEAPGAWRYEDAWPIARVKDRVLYPQADAPVRDPPLVLTESRPV